MKKSTAVTLTLVTTVALSACGRDRPEQRVAGYRDPSDTTRVSSTPRAGYVPFYFPVFVGGGYYDSRGVYRRSGAARGGTYANGSHQGTTTRGGFGSTGVGRSTYS